MARILENLRAFFLMVTNGEDNPEDEKDKQAQDRENQPERTADDDALDDGIITEERDDLSDAKNTELRCIV